jgi:peptidyl-prolyl cis-trans isomerase B (cyclophilin B)
MARSQDPDSAGSQFYICLAPQPSLDGQYTVFGQVTSGLDVLPKIAQGDQITSVRIEHGK